MKHYRGYKTGRHGSAGNYGRRDLSIVHALEHAAIDTVDTTPKVKHHQLGERGPGTIWTCKCGRNHRVRKDRGRPFSCALCGDVYRVVPSSRP